MASQDQLRTTAVCCGPLIYPPGGRCLAWQNLNIVKINDKKRLARKPTVPPEDTQQEQKGLTQWQTVPTPISREWIRSPYHLTTGAAPNNGLAHQPPPKTHRYLHLPLGNLHPSPYGEEGDSVPGCCMSSRVPTTTWKS